MYIIIIVIIIGVVINSLIVDASNGGKSAKILTTKNNNSSSMKWDKKKTKEKNDECFGGLEDRNIEEDFDFEKNLALFDKQAIWDKINASKPDLVYKLIYKFIITIFFQYKLHNYIFFNGSYDRQGIICINQMKKNIGMMKMLLLQYLCHIDLFLCFQNNK